MGRLLPIAISASDQSRMPNPDFQVLLMPLPGSRHMRLPLGHRKQIVHCYLFAPKGAHSSGTRRQSTFVECKGWISGLAACQQRRIWAKTRQMHRRLKFVSGLRRLDQRFEFSVHLIPKFIFHLVAKQARLVGQAVGLMGNHMATLATQFAHLRFINLMFDRSLNGGQLFVTTPN